MGGVLCCGLNGNTYESKEIESDVDIVVYGTQNAVNMMKLVRCLIQKPEHQDLRFVTPHHRLFKLNGRVVDIWGIPTKRFHFGIKKFISLDMVVCDDTIVDDSYSIFYPAVYGLESGRKLVSYNVGHKMQYANGCRIVFTGYQADIINQDNKRELIVLFEYFRQWEDISRDKIFTNRTFLTEKA